LGVRVFSLFFVFFVLSSIFLFYQKSKTLSIFVDLKKVPLMELRDSDIYDITYDGVNSFLHSKIAKKYKDRYELFGVVSNKKEQGRIDNLRAKRATLKDDILTLKGNVFFKSSDNRTLKSDTVVYNLKKDILSSDKDFVSTYKKSRLKGSSFIYYKKQKRFLAQNIIADINMEND